MKLELHKHRIERVEFSNTTNIQGHTLLIDKADLSNAIAQDLGAMVDVAICRPGEKVRITNVLDIIESRVKTEGRGTMFPGFLGSSEKVGSGVTKVLEGVAVIEVGSIPRVQEGLIDMGGLWGTIYSLFPDK